MTGKNHWHVMPHIWYKYQRLDISAIDISYPFILIYDSVCIFLYQQKFKKTSLHSNFVICIIWIIVTYLVNAYNVLQTFFSKYLAEATSQKIHEAYQMEYILKENLARNIAHVMDRHLMMFCTSAWTYEPYINGECQTLLEALVLETGLR